MIKKSLILTLFIFLFCLSACGGKKEKRITITNNLGVDLENFFICDADDVNNGRVIDSLLADGESTTFSLQDLFQSDECWVTIFADDFDKNSYEFVDVKLIDGVHVTLEGTSRSIYLDYQYDGSLVKFDGEIIYAYDEPVNNDFDFSGFWQYPDGTVMEIHDQTWYLYNGSGAIYQQGPMEFLENEAYLMMDDGSGGGGYLYFDADGNLHDGNDILIPIDNPFYDNPEDYYTGDILAGEWYYSDQDNFINFDGYGNYTFQTPDFYEDGTYYFDGYTITFYPYDNGYYYASFQDGLIYIDGDIGSYYYRSDAY